MRRAAGFTLIEMLVVVALAAVLLALAAPSFTALRTNQRLSAAASDLLASTLQARSEALRLNRRVTIAPLAPSGWRSGWQVYVDVDNNGAFDAGRDTVLATAPGELAGVSVTGAGGGAPPAHFSFDAQGFLVGRKGHRIVLKSAATGREKQVIVYVTGRARLCDPKLEAGCVASE